MGAVGGVESTGMVGIYTLQGEPLLRVDFPGMTCPGGLHTAGGRRKNFLRLVKRLCHARERRDDLHDAAVRRPRAPGSTTDVVGGGLNDVTCCI